MNKFGIFHFVGFCIFFFLFALARAGGLFKIKGTEEVYQQNAMYGCGLNKVKRI